MKLIHKLAFKRISTLLIYVIIILGSSVPGKKIPEFFQLTPDKLIHCLEYLVLGSFVGRWFVAEYPQFNTKKFAIGTLMICGLCGMTDEFYQNLTPNRTPDFYDWCLDFTGATLSLFLIRFWKTQPQKQTTI